MILPHLPAFISQLPTQPSLIVLPNHADLATFVTYSRSKILSPLSGLAYSLIVMPYESGYCSKEVQHTVVFADRVMSGGVVDFVRNFRLPIFLYPTLDEFLDEFTMFELHDLARRHMRFMQHG